MNRDKMLEAMMKAVTDAVVDVNVEEILEISFSSNWDVCLRLAESREERLKIVLVI